MRRIFITSLILLMSSVFAVENSQTNFNDYYSVSNVRVQKVTGDFPDYVHAPKNTARINLGEIIQVTDKLIALGTKVWEIIKKGEPNLNLTMAKPISVLPNTSDEAAAFSELDSWSAPEVNTYLIEFENVYGNVLVSFRYNVAFQYNGTLKGTGRYITGLQMNASAVHVSWGVSFDATSEMQSISNRGTSDDPIAGATMNLTYKVGTVFSKIVRTQSFHMSGTGEFKAY